MINHVPPITLPHVYKKSNLVVCSLSVSSDDEAVSFMCKSGSHLEICFISVSGSIHMQLLLSKEIYTIDNIISLQGAIYCKEHLSSREAAPHRSMLRKKILALLHTVK